MLSNVDVYYRWWKVKKGCLFVGVVDVEVMYFMKLNVSVGGCGY